VSCAAAVAEQLKQRHKEETASPCLAIHKSTMNQNSGKSGEGIVDRLNGALSALRRERDELHRQKDLALERLKLVKEERVAVEKVVQSMRLELQQLNIDTSDEGRKTENESIEMLVKEVETLSKEVLLYSVIFFNPLALLDSKSRLSFHLSYNRPAFSTKNWFPKRSCSLRWKVESRRIKWLEAINSAKRRMSYVGNEKKLQRT